MVETCYVQSFLKDTSALDLLQSSFCPIHGTEMALVTLMDHLCRQPAQGRLELLLLLDLMEAFNMVNYHLLAYHLTDIGVHGVA